MTKIHFTLLGAVALLTTAAASPNPTGQQIAEHGSNQGAPPCTVCHGTNYQGNPALKAPALAGLSASFIVARLAHYAGPQGHNAEMRQVATSLTMPERQAVAAYLAGLPKSGLPKPVTHPN